MFKDISSPPTLSIVVVSFALICCCHLISVQSNALDQPPRIIIAPKNQIALVKKSANLVCSADGDPKPTIEWTKDGKPLNKKRIPPIKFDKGSVLRIDPLRKDRDEGTYECFVENGVGEPIRSKAEVKVVTDQETPSGFPKILSPTTSRQYTVELDHPATIECIYEGDPKPEITWLRNYVPIDFSNPRYFIINSRELRIQNSNEKDNGDYECQASNIHGIAISSATQMTVRSRTIPPLFTIAPQSQYEVVAGPSSHLEIPCVAYGSPMPEITWMKNNMTLGSSSQPSIGTKTLILQQDLLVESANYTCVATSRSGTNSTTTTVIVKTLPAPPYNLTSQDVTHNSIRLSWSHTNAQDSSISYILRYRPRGNNDDNDFTEVPGITTSYYTISDLSPFTTYELIVQALNPVGRSQPSKSISVTTKDLSQSGTSAMAVRNIRARPSSPNTVYISWDPPELGGESVLGYIVYYTTDPNQPLTLWSSQTVDNGKLTTISDLSPDRVYTIQIQTKSNRGTGPLSSQVTVKTHLGVPGVPGDFKEVSKTTRTISLSWSRPTELTEPLSGYKIYWNDTFTQKSEQRTIPDVESYTLTDLSPDTAYKIRISAFSKRGEGSATAPIMVNTEPYVELPSAPHDVKVEVRGPKSFILFWREPLMSKHVTTLTGYKITVSESDSELDEGKNLTTIDVESDERSYEMRDLEPNTKYRVTIQATTAFGVGNSSKPLVIQTDEDVPGEPRNLRLQSLPSEASIKAEWEPPSNKEQSGLIRGYQLRVQELSTDPSIVNPPQIRDVPDEYAKSYIITGLQPSTDYEIQVAALTRKATGPFTQPKRATTRGGVPLRPEMSVRVYRDEPDSSVEISWTRPAVTMGTVISYQLKYSHKESNSHTNMIEFEPSRTSYVLKNLHKGVTYQFKLSAKNSNGWGQESTAYVDVPESVPEAGPTDLKYKLISPTDVALSWSPPPEDKRNGKIIGYLVTMGKVGVPPKEYQTSDNRIVLNSLSENTEYIFTVKSKTSIGYGPSSEKKFSTLRDVPPSPSNVKAMATSFNSMMVWWDELAYFPGILGYRILYTNKNPSEDLEKWQSKNVTITGSVTIKGLLENGIYTVCISAINTAGLGKLSEFVTLQIIPNEVPVELRSSSVTTHSAVLSWKPPLKLAPLRYRIDYDAYKEFNDNLGKLQVLPIPKQTIELDSSVSEHSIDNLMPYTSYRFNVTAVPPNESFRPPAEIVVTTAMAAPKPMVKPDLLAMSRTGQEITMMLPLASEEYGPINHYYVVVIPHDISTLQDPDSYSLEDLSSTQSHETRGPYITAKFPRLKVKRQFVVGDGETYDGYLNRPLRPDQKYHVFVRAVVDTSSKSLYTSSPMSDAIGLGSTSGQTTPIGASPQATQQINNRNGLGLLLVLGFLIILVLSIITVLLKRQRQALKSANNHINETTMKLLPDLTDRPYATAQPSDPVELRRLNYQSPAMINHPPVPISELANHIEELRTGDNLKQEYESIEPGQQFTWENSNLDVNRPKNRYGNVVAYDHSRVVLRPIDGIIGSDYINANYCDGYRKPNAYIATQGPLSDTVSDFWRMVWEQNSKTLVMMTQIEERGRVKCIQYWPARESETYHLITVTVIDVEELAYYSIRTFKIQHQNSTETREIRQFQFTAWPDHGVPNHPTPFIMFLRRIKSSNPPDAGPLVVLCSAGVGRTGCFIVIDSMIERIKYENTVDIYGHVTCLRAQRNYIVQTEDQYMFIHDAVLEAVIASNTCIPAQNLEAHLHSLSQVVPDGTATGLELEFKRLAAVRYGPQKFTSANLPVNKFKNRLMNILPYESTRVCIEPIAGYEGSDYINASFIDGYRQRNAYIATQSPLPDTVNDFWRMVSEHNASIIVMLTRLKEMGREKCTQYWPAERSADYVSCRVEMLREYNMTPNYVVREFNLIDNDPSYNRTVRQFHYIDWPEQGVPKSGDSFIDFIVQVHKTKEQFGLEGPIVVHCSAGVGRTGVFIALSILLEQLQNEGIADLFSTVRTLRMQRPGMLQTDEQYQFCYSTALDYVRSFT
ncbi:Tyrosine-protein phosphatase Lar, partial [Fragariocoptes setiger]